VQLIELVSNEFKQRKKTLSLAESCTGGAISAALVRLPGASDFFLGSLVVYSNEWKKQFLHVSTLERFGAVSPETVIHMAQELLAVGGADFAVAVSGIAGPFGGTADKPVGTIWIAIGEKGKKIHTTSFLAKGNRAAIIDATVEFTLKELLETVRKLGLSGI
jgi:PncC family amidohydrolase